MHIPRTRFTAEESERGNVIENDLYTQVLMMTTKFIVGDTDIESGWEDYLASLEKIGLAELTEIRKRLWPAGTKPSNKFCTHPAGASQGETAPRPFLKANGKERGKTTMIHTVETAARLLELPAATLHAGDVAQVLGRLVPGDGSWLYRWDPNSTAGPNGGTVLAPAGMPAAGRWLLCHSGTVDARCFGVFGPDVPADDALDALMADGSVTRIVFGTDVNFTRRHTFTRGHVTLDFTGHTVTAQGVEHAKHNDPFGALFHFTGVPGDDVRTFPLAQPMRELYDVFEVPGAGGIPLYSWWQVSVNSLAGREEKEIDKLLCVTERIDESHVRVNYKMGWPLDAGRVMTWRRVEPIERVCVQDVEFRGNEGGEETGAQPLAFEYAVRCDVRDVRARHTYWPVLLRRHNTEYVTERCSLANPIEVVVGGTGYLTQQIHCLYGKVRDCTTSNARHLNDFTGSAYCMVENCHGDGDFHGAYVTHGQFEHDLTYVGNSGLLSFANSGPTWGSSAKRITVVRLFAFGASASQRSAILPCRTSPSAAQAPTTV